MIKIITVHRNGWIVCGAVYTSHMLRFLASRECFHVSIPTGHKLINCSTPELTHWELTRLTMLRTAGPSVGDRRGTWADINFNVKRDAGSECKMLTDHIILWNMCMATSDSEPADKLTKDSRPVYFWPIPTCESFSGDHNNGNCPYSYTSYIECTYARHAAPLNLLAEGVARIVVVVGNSFFSEISCQVKKANLLPAEGIGCNAFSDIDRVRSIYL